MKVLTRQFRRGRVEIDAIPATKKDFSIDIVLDPAVVGDHRTAFTIELWGVVDSQKKLLAATEYAGGLRNRLGVFVQPRLGATTDTTPESLQVVIDTRNKRLAYSCHVTEL